MRHLLTCCSRGMLITVIAATLLALVCSTSIFAQEPSPLTTAAKGVKDGATIVHRALAQLGHEISVNAVYVPDEGGLVHLKDDPREGDAQRHIRLEADLVFLYDWENELPAAQARKLVGFGMPQPGPVEGVPVRWYFSKNLIPYTQLKAEDWDGILPTWWNYTNAQGKAIAHLYLKADQRLGGVKTVIDGEVRVVAKVQKGLPLGPAALGVTVGEELFQPTEAVIPVRIERHIPTEWEGEITVSRTVTGIARANTTSKDGSYTESVFESQLWDGTMEITNIRLNKEGTGSGEYSFKVQGEWNQQINSKKKTVCGERTVSLPESRDITRSGKGEETGTTRIDLHVDPRGPLYTVGMSTFATGMAFTLGYSGDGSEHREWSDCQDDYAQDFGVESVYPPNVIVRAFQLAYRVPQSEWPSFDPDAPQLNGFAQWNSTLKSDDGTTSYEITTTMQWSLRRLYE